LTQEALWDQFLAARDAYGQRAAVVKSQLQGLSARLTQNGANWEETRQALATLDAFFAAFDDNLPAATGLKEVLGRTAAYMKTQGGRMKLRTLLEFAEDLEGFLKEPAQELIAIHEYLNDPSLSIDDHSELVRIRSRILTYLGSGEQLFRDRSALQRTAQAFMAAYRRSYLACHAAQYRASKFQAFSTFRESQEYLTLERLSRLAVEMDIDKPAVDTMLDDQIAQHCSGTGLAESLSDRPTCPRCGLRLDDEVRLLSIDQIREATLGAIRTYIQQLHSPEITATVQAYVESLGADSPVNHALNRVQTLSLKARPREVMSVFSEDVVAHLNRALGGQLVHSRRLDVLGAKLADRTLTRDEIARIVEAWLEGDDDVRPEDLVVVDI
ncbi:MAG TPA: hypothetical protein QGH10_06030, partial [Armatimonadota bacterium]|nr:hypothetical protein [Armatimonadota bacterium]